MILKKFFEFLLGRPTLKPPMPRKRPSQFKRALAEAMQRRAQQEQKETK